MREIKFRVWTGKRMLCDNYVMIDAYGSVSFIDEDDYYGQPAVQVGWFPMQWTGKRDVVGNDLYEGDILATKGYMGDDYYSGSKILVEWDAEEFEYIGRILGTKGHWLDFDEFAGKIIGNIYENPELLLCEK